MASKRNYRASFLALVDERGPDECWPWLGSTRDGARGRFHIGKRAITASRLAIELATGNPVPFDKFACHHCDNPNCVNPAHLYVGDHQTNVGDRVRRGRGADIRGTEHWSATITNEDALAIREAYVAERVTMRELAVRFGTTKSVVQHVLRGDRWKHVGGPVVKRPTGAPRALSEEVETKMVARYRGGGISYQALAREYGTTIGVVASALRRDRRS